MPDEPEKITAAEITPADMPTPTAPANTPPGPQQGGTAPSEVHNPATAGSTPAPAPLVAPGTLDDKGKPFDPARHLPRKHPHGGHWMPKGGRKPGVKASTAAPSYIPAEPPPAPADAAPAGESAIPTSPAPAVDHATDAGEVIARTAQLTAGVLLDAPKETVASPAEHKHMVEATAAYIRSKNWQAAAGAGLLLMFGAWLLKVLQQPGPQARLRAWLTPAAPEPLDVTPEDKRPAAPAQPRGPVIDAPRNIPPLATP